MAAACRMIDKQEDNKNSQGIATSTLSTPSPFPAPSTRRFQAITKKIISAPTTRRSSTGMHHNAPTLPSSEARSSSSGKDQSYSFPKIIACTDNDVMDRRSSHKVARLPNSGKDCQDSCSAAPKGVASVGEKYAEGRSGIRDSASMHRPKELCRYCKASIMESVCFIANDGRISAALTGAAYTRLPHHCKVSGCAANRSCCSSLSPSSKKGLHSERHTPLNPQPRRMKSHKSSSIGGDSQSTSSSLQGEDCSKQEMEFSLRSSVEMSNATGFVMHDKMQELNSKQTDSHISFGRMYFEEGNESHEGTDSPCCGISVDQNGLDVFSPCEDLSLSSCMHVSKGQGSSGEHSHVENVDIHSNVATSCISSGIHEDDDDDDVDDEKASLCGDDIQTLNDFKSLFYHGDNEYSCSEGGTGATITPNSLIKGVFNDLSNLDIEHVGSENTVSPQRRSTMAWMRQKYLDSLREQELESIRLRKQEIMARKQAGDWMLDSHMEEVLHKLAPNGEVHVKVLVEAYETVIHHSDSENAQTLKDHDHLENLQSYASS